ncbi:hypothetical protein RJ641_028031 [Dillenia turbinata]|uniref:Uncharacterized protein n=1 Tax=Dillenia turbinata TaxID=194707 RepID=A0AAN8VYI9_9MAGN
MGVIPPRVGQGRARVTIIGGDDIHFLIITSQGILCCSCSCRSDGSCRLNIASTKTQTNNKQSHKGMDMFNTNMLSSGKGAIT